jgi:hypothetical protein
VAGTGRLVGAVALGAVAGIIVIGLARFALAPAQAAVHFHANWALFIDGQRLDLSHDRYMEDVVACGHGGQVAPEGRVHMHNGEDHVVHVHHDGVSWGHFFQNLGFAASRGFLALDDGRILTADDGGRTLKYVVNGIVVDDVVTRMIRPGDRLLVSFGPESPEEVLRTQFPQVAEDAPIYDTHDDPGACAGEGHSHRGDRWRRAFLW